MSTITLVPIGGLFNRLRAIAAATALARDTHSCLQVRWKVDSTLGCTLDTLFQPQFFDFNYIQQRGHQYSMPCRRNLFLPRLLQTIRHDQCFYEGHRMPSTDEEWRQAVNAHRNTLIITGLEFYSTTRDLYTSLFKPTLEVTQQADIYMQSLTSCAYGLHIRRTDNAQSIAQSPLQLFEEQIDRILSEQSDVSFFLATDSDTTKQHFTSRYGNRIVCAPDTARRDTVQGMVQAAAEFFVLTRMKHVYGSYYSSYSASVQDFSCTPVTILVQGGAASLPRTDTH